MSGKLICETCKFEKTKVCLHCVNCIVGPQFRELYEAKGETNEVKAKKEKFPED